MIVAILAIWASLALAAGGDDDAACAGKLKMERADLALSSFAKFQRERAKTLEAWKAARERFEDMQANRRRYTLVERREITDAAQAAEAARMKLLADSQRRMRPLVDFLLVHYVGQVIQLETVAGTQYTAVLNAITPNSVTGEFLLDLTRPAELDLRDGRESTYALPLLDIKVGSLRELTRFFAWQVN